MLGLNTKAAATVAATSIGTAVAASASATITLSGVTVPPGVLIVVLVLDQAGPGIGNVVDSVNGTYTLATSVPVQTAGNVGGLFFLDSAAALSNASITYTQKNPVGGSLSLLAFYLTGTAGAALDTAVTATATGNSTAPSVTSGIPGTPREVIVGAAFFLGSSTGFSQAPGFNLAPATTNPVVGQEIGAGILLDNTATAATFAPTLSTGEQWGALVVGFKSSLNQVSVVSLPSIVTYGFGIIDLTTSTAIPAGTTVQATDFYNSTDCGPLELVNTDTLATLDDGQITDSVGSTNDNGAVTDMVATITLSTNLPAAGVANGDTLMLSGVPLNVPLYYEPPNSHWLTSACLTNAAVNANAAFYGTPLSANFLGTGDFLGNPDFLDLAQHETSFIDGWVEIAYAINLPSTPLPQWSRWQQFTPGVFPATAWKLRIGLESSAPSAQPTCTAFSFTTQLPTRTDNYVNKSVSGATTITFTPDGTTIAQPFNSGVNGNPLPRVQGDWQATAGDTYTITGLSLSQLTIQFFNGGSAAGPRTATIVVQGA